MSTPQEAQSVLRFWFGDPPGENRKAWFEKDAAFDAQIRARFVYLHDAAVRGELAPWREDAALALALIVLTDQFPRNMFRGSPAAFSTDSIALQTARDVIAADWDSNMQPVERMFAYLPFEHSEALPDQEKSLELFAGLAGFPETANNADYARRHWEIVKRFGRFPHRNGALGRVSTPEELEFLAGPGSSF